MLGSEAFSTKNEALLPTVCESLLAQREDFVAESGEEVREGVNVFFFFL